MSFILNFFISFVYFFAVENPDSQGGHSLIDYIFPPWGILPFGEGGGINRAYFIPIYLFIVLLFFIFIDMRGIRGIVFFKGIFNWIAKLFYAKGLSRHLLFLHVLFNECKDLKALLSRIKIETERLVREKENEIKGKNRIEAKNEMVKIRMKIDEENIHNLMETDFLKVEKEELEIRKDVFQRLLAIEVVEEISPRLLFKIWMEEVFVKNYSNNVQAFAYWGAAILILLIGLRGIKMITAANPEPIIVGLELEGLLLLLLGFTLIYTPEEEPEKALAEGGALPSENRAVNELIFKLDKFTDAFAKKNIEMFVTKEERDELLHKMKKFEAEYQNFKNNVQTSLSAKGIIEIEEN